MNDPCLTVNNAAIAITTALGDLRMLYAIHRRSWSPDDLELYTGAANRLELASDALRELARSVRMVTLPAAQTTEVS